MYSGKFLISLTCFVGMLWVAQGTWLSGEGYRNLKFSGSNFVQLPKSVSSGAGKEFSFEAWIMVPAGTTNRPIITRFNSSIAAPNNNLNDFDLQINPQGNVVFFVGGSFDLGFLMMSRNPVEPDRWYHVAFSIEYDDIASPFPYRAELFVDNWVSGVVSRDSNEALWFGPGYPRIVLNDEHMVIGKYQNDDSMYPNGQFFYGSIDEVRIWRGRRLGSDFLNFANRTLNDVKMDTWTLTAAEGGSSANELVASYNFNGFSTTTLFDKSKNANHAAIMGNAVATYAASDVQIITYAYATGEIPLKIQLYGINKEDITQTGFQFQIQYLSAEVKGELYNYDPTNSGVPNMANPKRPAGIQTPGIGSQIVNNGMVSGDSVVFVYVPQVGLSGRFFYVVTDGVSGTVSKRTEVRVQIACVQPVDIIDMCGVCNGQNSSVDACGKCFGNNATCQGCDSVPNSGKHYDACGVCGGDNHTCWGCDHVANSHKTYDSCGVCGGHNETCTGCDGVLNSGKHYDACGVCDGNGQSCWGCDHVSNSGKHYDACGVCGGDNHTCWDCAHTPNGHAMYDACGVCNGNGHTCWDCMHIPNGHHQYDACGVCGGHNATCMGCDSVANSHKVYDVCGVCAGDNTTCWGCDHIPNSGLTYDNCGVCGGDDACRGCDGELFSGLVYDFCGVCGGNNGTCKGCDQSGGGEYDACGVCRGDNSTCGGCDGMGGAYDYCGVCAGDNSTCTCVLYHGYHVQELDYILLQWGLNHTIDNLNNVIEALDGALERLEDYNGDLDLAAVVLYINQFLGTTFKDFEDVVDAFTYELDVSLGNIYTQGDDNRRFI